ncbi:MAG: hypothetical protein K2W96_14950 [Gemmataceae bacterium]|nr:hypothetical protein [Gemmataceae bacterium]
MRSRYGLAFLASALLSSLILLPGCGTGRDDDDAPPRTRGGKGAPVSVATKKRTPVAGTYEGVISGKVKWNGGAVNPAALAFVTDPTKQDSEYCKQASEYETRERSFWVGDNGNLGNVVVWIEPEEGKFFDVPAAQLKAFAKGGEKGKRVVSQPRCAFLPHVTLLFQSYYKDGKQVETGQEFIVLNDATVSHNANVKAGSDNLGGGTLPPGKQDTIFAAPTDDPIVIGCNIHPWMKGYARSFEHPYAAVSRVGGDIPKKVYQNRKAEDFGTFKIEGVPVGAKVTLKAWHETLGVFFTKEIAALKKDNTEEIAAQPK